MRDLVGPTLRCVGTFALGLGGAALFDVLRLPAAWLAGAMTTVAIGALLGWAVLVPGAVRNAAFILVGASMGSAMRPETVRQVAAWPLSMALLAASVVVTVFSITRLLERRHGWDSATARFSAIPGALTSVIIMAASSSADVPRVAFVQTLRLIVLVGIIPPFVNLLGGAEPLGLSAGRPPPGGALETAGLIATCALVGYLLHRLRVPAGALLGAMLASTFLHGTGILPSSLPPALLAGSYTVTGAVIGVRFQGTTFATIRQSLQGAVESGALGIIVACGFAGIGTALLGVAFGQLFLALAPGGIEAMSIMAFVLNVDPAFVSAHQVARFLALSLLTPLWLPRSALVAALPARTSPPER